MVPFSVTSGNYILNHEIIQWLLLAFQPVNHYCIIV